MQTKYLLFSSVRSHFIELLKFKSSLDFLSLLLLFLLLQKSLNIGSNFPLFSFKLAWASNFRLKKLGLVGCCFVLLIDGGYSQKLGEPQTGIHDGDKSPLDVTRLGLEKLHLSYYLLKI